MFPMWIFTGLGALILASIAAFFSITGLAALYAAAFIPVIIMAVGIEYGKIAATFWVHRNFRKVSRIWIVLLVVTILGSMAVTSGGVYGFLTKGHLDQQTPITETTLRVQRLDQRIAAEQLVVVRAQKRLDQLDSAIDAYVKINFITKALAERKLQEPERKEVQEAVDGAYKRIDELSDKRLVLKQGLSEIEAKLGPVKFLAKLFGADTDNTVIYFTLLIVLLLDPFAILMVIATSISYDRWRNKVPANVKIVEKEVIKEVIKEVEVPVEVEKIVEKVIEKEIPITIEAITEFLETPEMQEELASNPALIEEVEKLLSSLLVATAEENETEQVSLKGKGWYYKGNPLKLRPKKPGNS